MSVINRKPLINTILSGLNTTQLNNLRNCINGEGGEPIFRSLKPFSDVKLTSADYGVKPIRLELKYMIGGMNIYEGYLVYTASQCYVISYASDASQYLDLIHVNPSTGEVNFMNGALSILELRSELDDELDVDRDNIDNVSTKLYSHTIYYRSGLITMNWVNLILTTKDSLDSSSSSGLATKIQDAFRQNKFVSGTLYSSPYAQIIDFSYTNGFAYIDGTYISYNSIPTSSWGFGDMVTEL